MTVELELTPEQLRRTCDPQTLELEAGPGPDRRIIGQERATRALKFGLGIKAVGFNVFVAGAPDHEGSRDQLEALAAHAVAEAAAAHVGDGVVAVQLDEGPVFGAGVAAVVVHHQRRAAQQVRDRHGDRV